MRHDAIWLTASDAATLYVNRWLPEQPPKAVVMIVHGVAEHSERYARLAQTLVSANYAVYAHDQRGHGHTAQHGVLGHFADRDGWHKVVDDLADLNRHIRQRHPGAPIFMFGHSMGSYIVQSYLIRHKDSLQGVVLSGSNYQPAVLYRLAKALARFESWRQGPSGRSALLEFLSFNSFNKAFTPTRTAYDWLSRDPLEVDRYVEDPWCGFRWTNQLWLDMLGGLQQISTPKNLAQIDSALPLLVIGGARDPVSDGKRLEDLRNALRQAGSRAVQLRVYPDARHELLNESNRDEVTSDLLQWFEQTLTGSHAPRLEATQAA